MKIISASGIVTLVALCAITMSACKDSAATGPVNNPAKRPNAGSTYTYSDITININGSVADTTTVVETYTVKSSGISFAGKTNVAMFEGISGTSSADTLYMNYETNGDMSFYGGSDNFSALLFGSPWVPLPMNTGGTVNLPGLDTTYSDAGVQYHNTATRSVKYVGTEDLTVGTQKISARKVQVNVTLNGTVGGVVQKPVTISNTLLMSPELGFWIKNTSVITNLLNDKSTETTVLTGYTLK